MSYCFNPNCHSFESDDINQDVCHRCGTSLIIGKRYRSKQLLGKSQLALTLEVEDLHCIDSNKVLKILLTNYSKAVKLFQQEAIVLQQMDHPGIPKVEPGGYFIHHVRWSDEALHCLVMEKIAGLNLEQWLEKQSKPINERRAINWLKQLLDIVTHIHQQQYFHRDIKPANIILKPNGKLALIDFGATRKITTTYLGKVGTTKGVTSIGTPGYMPPEQIDGGALPQSDFFALGRTLIHLCTGKHPQELAKNLHTGESIWRTEAPHISEPLADLVDYLTNPVPGKRPHNTQVILSCLADGQNLPNNKIRRWQRRFSQLSTASKLGLILLPPSIVCSFIFATRSYLNLNRPLCNNLTCVNRDPIDNKCDLDSQTITSNIGNYQVSTEELKAYRIELRYSKRCNATWARTEAPHYSTHYIEDILGQRYGTATVPVDQWKRHYADMAPGKNIEIRACAKPKKGNTRCTNFVKF